ncbi:MAG TPA: MFS transporter [Candidatus Baltobacteraceae bacterium]|nr:MFS transporter [Candidatus Baltobacteraceae bacterium]
MNQRPFYFLLISTLVSEIAFNLPMGALPLALLRDGATHSEVAFAMGGGVFAQLFGSVPIGAVVDRVGRLRMVRASVILVSLSTFGMTFLHGPVWGGLLMGLRGFSATSYVTAEFAYVSEIIPKERSVSAVSILGTIGNVVFAFAPALAVWMWNHGIGREQFSYAGLIALAGGTVLWFLPRGHGARRTKRRSRLILMRSKWLPAMGFLSAVAMQSGVNTALAVVTFTQRGIGNGALIFTSMAIMAAALRYPAARAVERFGVGAVVLPVAAVQIAGCLAAASAHSAGTVLLAGALLGCAWSAVVPVGVALFFQHSSPGTRGVAMGAYNLSFAIGSSSGALLAALLTRFGLSYATAISACALAPLLALPFVYLRIVRREPAARTGIPPDAGSPSQRPDQALRK